MDAQQYNNTTTKSFPVHQINFHLFIVQAYIGEHLFAHNNVQKSHGRNNALAARWKLNK